MKKLNIIALVVFAAAIVIGAVFVSANSNVAEQEVVTKASTASCGAEGCNGQCGGNCGVEGCGCAKETSICSGEGSCGGECDGSCGVSSCGCSK